MLAYLRLMMRWQMLYKRPPVKRIFAHIGFSMAAALIVLNVFPAAAFYAAGALFALLLFSLCIQKYRLALAVPMCLGAALLACILFIVFTDSAGHVIGALDGKTVSCTAYVTDFPERFLDTERLSGEGVVLTSMDGKVSYNNQLDVRMRRYSRDIKRIVQEENARQNSR